MTGKYVNNSLFAKKRNNNKFYNFNIIRHQKYIFKKITKTIIVIGTEK